MPSLNKKDICIRCNAERMIFVSINIRRISGCGCLSRPTMVDKDFFLLVRLIGVFLGWFPVIFIWGSSILSAVVRVIFILPTVNTLRSSFISGGSSPISSFTLKTPSSRSSQLSSVIKGHKTMSISVLVLSQTCVKTTAYSLPQLFLFVPKLFWLAENQITARYF